ncbi:NAD(P)-dependent oxidoreductase [Kutzneria buriramensis]|uniref:NAD-dependent epimerase/dehydratase family protein n=1 Tax=Kutzneria buriramensis TaxID=1045776 RepID=A0A3E0GZV6_9PSEU|nr:NAD-dependent epimerase/dehydratase family protein [Kutzneria buriramensis]REH35707.1 NAD-dependent epimerase/dehydratase family protein [Kutzneria buriramensis]
MRIIGTGFIARELGALRDRHPQVTVIAAGVSSTSVTDDAEFARERELVLATLRECRALGHTVVFCSTASAALYGATGEPRTEDEPAHPVSAYGWHKLAMESVVRDSGVPWLILRISHLVGRAQQPWQMMPFLAAQVRSGVVSIHSGAHRDLLDVRHLVLAVDRLLAETRCQTVNVASATPEPVERIVTEIERRLGVRPRRIAVPGRAGRTVADVSRLHELVPEFAAIDFGVRHLPALLDRYLNSWPDSASGLKTGGGSTVKLGAWG